VKTKKIEPRRDKIAIAEQELKSKFKEYQIANYTLGIARTRADHARSVDVLRANGYEPLTHQQALTSIVGRLKDASDGEWFWLADQGINEKSGVHNWDQEGNLTMRKVRDIEKTVYVVRGAKPLSLIVNTVSLAEYGGWRFLLIAGPPGRVARVVVGIKQTSPSLSYKRGRLVKQ
jgi:hypothetical protein